MCERMPDRSGAHVALVPVCVVKSQAGVVDDQISISHERQNLKKRKEMRQSETSEF